MDNSANTTEWYVLTHLEMKRFKEWLLAENVKRLDQGLSVLEPFFPSQFFDDSILAEDFARLVFIKGTKDDIEELRGVEASLGRRIRLMPYKNTEGEWAVVPGKMMDTFINECLKHRGYFEIAPSIDGIEAMDRVKIKTGPFAGCEASVVKVRHAKGDIQMEVAIELVHGVLNVKMSNVSRNDVDILNRSAVDAIRADFIDYTQNHLLEILEHRVKGKDDMKLKQKDLAMLARLFRYSRHQVEGESARCHFLSLMLICAHLIRSKQEELTLKTAAQEALAEINRRSESKAATDTRAYLWIALYISTYDPAYREAAKQYIREHQPKSPKLRRFVSLIRTGKRV